MFSVLDNWSEIRRPKAIAPATRIARINVFVASVNCKVTSCCVALNAILPGTRNNTWNHKNNNWCFKYTTHNMTK